MVRVSDRFELCRAQVILLQMHFDLGIFYLFHFQNGLVIVISSQYVAMHAL